MQPHENGYYGRNNEERPSGRDKMMNGPPMDLERERGSRDGVGYPPHNHHHYQQHRSNTPHHPPYNRGGAGDGPPPPHGLHGGGDHNHNFNHHRPSKAMEGGEFANDGHYDHPHARPPQYEHPQAYQQHHPHNYAPFHHQQQQQHQHPPQHPHHLAPYYQQYPPPQQQQQQPLPKTHFQKCTPQTLTISHYKRLLQIGEGTYGQVYQALCLHTHTTVALKKIRLSRVEDGIPRNVIREIKILKALQHDNMVRMIDVVSSKGYEYLDEEDERKDEKRKRLQKQKEEKERHNNDSSYDDNSKHSSANNHNSNQDDRESYKGNLFLVLEYISHDLSGILDMGYRFTPIQAKHIFKQLLQVLGYMHTKGYVHRDIKSSNILLDGNFKVKLADFGLARCMDES